VKGLIILAALSVLAVTGYADPNPQRRVTVLEYRAGSSALRGIAQRVVDRLGTRTSLALLSPDQTRALYGDHVEQALVRCAGESECVARIGQKVGAAEVILIGVSELGDVILTMQRIDVPERRVASRIAESLASGTQPTEPQLDQYLARLLPPSDFLRFGIIDIIANEAGAAVTVGGEPRGVTPLPPIKLSAPASYDIRLEKTGFIPFAVQVAVPPDGQVRVNAQLQKKGAGSAWYQHWYVLAAASAIVVGAAGTTAHFATRGDDGDGKLRLTPPVVW
jgi:hypothetical protein